MLPPENTSPSPESDPLSRPRSLEPAPSELTSKPSEPSPPPEPQTPSQPAPAVAPPRSSSSLSLLLLLASLFFLAFWFVGPKIVEEYQYAATKGRLRAEYENAVVILDDDPLKKVSMTSRLIAHRVKPSVVSILTQKEGESVRDQNGNLRIFGGPVEGFGSGVIVSTDGYIVTNAHVVDQALKTTVQLHDRRQYTAVIIGRDRISDIAVLKIEADDLIPGVWGDSDLLDVGSIVWAVGSPYRYQQTVTSGIISAKDRAGNENPNGGGGRAQSLLQTDAAVNPGNSGGPLVNSSGNIVGINTSIFGKTFQGISFAVPSSTARFVYEQIRENGKVTRGYLGVVPLEVQHFHAIDLSLPDLDGALLSHVEPNSPAWLAGLRPRDVVRTWNGDPIPNYNSVFRLAEMSPPGSQVDVTLIRDGSEQQAQITIGQVPSRFRQ